MRTIVLMIIAAITSSYMLLAQDLLPLPVNEYERDTMSYYDICLCHPIGGYLGPICISRELSMNDYVLSGTREFQIRTGKNCLGLFHQNSILNVAIDGKTVCSSLLRTSYTITSSDTVAVNISYDFGEAGQCHDVVVSVTTENGKVLFKNRKKVLTVLGATSKKMVLMEMACGILCSPCHAHIEEAHKFTQEHKDSVAFVIYNKAPVGVGTYDEPTKPYNNFHKTFNIGYQSSVMMDRTFDQLNLNSQEGDDTEVISDIAKAYNNQINSEYVPVSVSVTPKFDYATRKVDLNLKADFTDYASGDMRFYVVLTQDTVRGPNGTNTYTSYAQATLPQFDSVYGYQGEYVFGGWYAIPNYPHTNVCKYQPNGFFGAPGIIPAEVSPGSSYEENISFTLPEFGNPDLDYDVVPIDPPGIEVIVSVVKYGEFKSRQVLNTCKAPLTKEINGVCGNSETGSTLFRIVNQVTKGSFIVETKAKSPSSSDLKVYDIYGKLCKTVTIDVADGLLRTGIDATDLPDGVYFLSLNLDGTAQSDKLVIIK